MLVAVAAVALSTSPLHAHGAGVAVNCASCLGPPTNDAPDSYVYPSADKRVPIELRAGKLPEVLLLGSDIDGSTAAIRWPLVKALGQFGRFSNLSPVEQHCPSGARDCLPPSFDLLRARYTSHFVSFTERDLLSAAGVVDTVNLTPAERQVYDHWARPHIKGSERKKIMAALYGNTSPYGTGHVVMQRLPLLVFGDRMDRPGRLTVSTDFMRTVPSGAPSSSSTELSFAEAEQAITTGRVPAPPAGQTYTGEIVYHVNAEANMFTALICRVDGGKPSTVCGRPVIRSILKGVR